MTGKKLLEQVFAKEIEEHGELELYEIEDLDGVTCFDESLSYNSGWYNYYAITFRYEGKSYSFEKREHTSDNVSDTEWYTDKFHEVVATNELEKAIDRIIKGIEDETVGSWEELIHDLEGLKQNFGHWHEVEE